jgi:hypothetical protein
LTCGWGFAIANLKGARRLGSAFFHISPPVSMWGQSATTGGVDSAMPGT